MYDNANKLLETCLRAPRHSSSSGLLADSGCVCVVWQVVVVEHNDSQRTAATSPEAVLVASSIGVDLAVKFRQIRLDSPRPLSAEVVVADGEFSVHTPSPLTN